MKTRLVLTLSLLTGLTTGFLAGCATADSGVAQPAQPPQEPAKPVTAVAAPAVPSPYDKPGFVTELDQRDGRLWVFHADSDDLKAFREKGRPARHVLRPGVGPDGLTLKSTESETIAEYAATKPGFVVKMDERDGRLWVFDEGSDDLKAFREKGRPARHVLRPGAGPLGLTLKSTEFETLDAYQAAFN